MVKTGTWRLISLGFLVALTYGLSGSLALASSVALIDLMFKSALYFLHEHVWSKTAIGREAKNFSGAVVWFTGLSGSGKSTVADAVAEKLKKRLLPVSRIDGDVARRTFSSDLGFSSADRKENCRRAAHVAAYAKESSIVLASFISPQRKMRDYIRKLLGYKDVFVVQIDCPVNECAKRDPKGMYRQLKGGCFRGNPFTGMHPEAPYESEINPDLILYTWKESVSESADKVIAMLSEAGYV